MIDFAGNDYLGLARDPRVVAALCEGARVHGVSVTSSRFALGWTDTHERLEGSLASFLGAPSACLLGSTYLGGLVYFSALALKFKTALCDELCHSNLILGMKAAGIKAVFYKHLDTEDLARKMTGDCLIVTDGIYGISGEVAPLKAIARLADDSKSELLVDDAHGFGVMGASGRGTLEFTGTRCERVTVLGSLSKALGCHGGFLTGSASVIAACKSTAAVGGSSHPPAAMAAAALEALSIVRTEPQRRARVFENAGRLREMFVEQGIPVVSGETPILALQLADGAEARELSEHFLKQGFRIPYFKYASEPRENLLRAVARSVYTEEDLERFGAALRSFARALAPAPAKV